MARIQELEPHIADLIAAGEVVERPASVVKELMENAIDAGATQITVEIQHGGMSLIRVTDNGAGIPAEDAQLAFLRHATSKLRTAQDLEAIGTLGFRGEALAAIAAVSRVELLTRTGDADFGVALSLEGGAVKNREETGCPQGTTMMVKDLFFNTPARQKFMKKDAAEGAAVFALVQRVALAAPGVSIRFIRDGKTELHTPGDGDLKAAIYSVFGRDLAAGFSPAKGSGEGVKVTGFLSLPSCLRGSRNYQHFILNGRPIKSRLLVAALEEAYANQKTVGKFPGCVIHIETPPHTVDVNVHPAKTEVKFLSDKKIFDGVYYTALSALKGEDRRPTVTFSQPAPAPLSASQSGGLLRDSAAALTIEPPAPAARPLGRSLQDFQTQWRRDMEKNPATAWVGFGKEERGGPGENITDFPPIPTREEPLPNQFVIGEAIEAQGTPEAEAIKAPPAAPVTSPTPAAAPWETPEEIPWRICGEAFSTYILVESGSDLLLIDKHAAHERLHFDRMKEEGYRPMAQSLLEPLILTLPPEEAAAILAEEALFSEFGFDLSDFGGDAILIREIPFDIAPGETEGVLGELAQSLLTRGKPDPAAARDSLLHTMACKAAIKGGQKNAPEELLPVAQAVLSGQVKYCPHGRPVAVTLTRAQLERQFGRA